MERVGAEVGRFPVIYGVMRKWKLKWNRRGESGIKGGTAAGEKGRMRVVLWSIETP